MAGLTFNSTFTVKEFKEKNSIENLNIIEVPKKDGSGNCLIMINADTNKSIGLVSNVKPFSEITKPVISDVTGEDGTTFFMLHQLGESKATVIATL